VDMTPTRRSTGGIKIFCARSYSNRHVTQTLYRFFNPQVTPPCKLWNKLTEKAYKILSNRYD